MIVLVSATTVTFWICAVLAIAGGVGLITARKPVYSALSLALVMVALAVIYASLNAPFLFAVQIIVYTGAVLMLFLFVLMLVGRDAHDSLTAGLKGHRVGSVVVGIGVLALLVLAVGQAVMPSVGLDQANANGNVVGLAHLIFSTYVVAFEATAALLITAAVAAMILAHPERLTRKPGQPEAAERRLTAFAEQGAALAPLPNSGIFARHNSVATPALLPDGSVAPRSVSPIVAQRVNLLTADELWAPHDAVLADLDAGFDGAELVDEDDLIEGDPVEDDPAPGDDANADQSDGVDQSTPAPSPDQQGSDHA